MKAEIIAVGSELLTPDSSDTNSLYLTHKLNEAGCEVHLKTIVGDDQNEIERLLQQALERSELILFSGGLGPTMDDRTRAAVAGALNRPLISDPEILEDLRRKFASRGFKMSPNNELQAEVIRGAEAVDQDVREGLDMLGVEQDSNHHAAVRGSELPDAQRRLFLE